MSYSKLLLRNIYQYFCLRVLNCCRSSSSTFSHYVAPCRRLKASTLEVLVMTTSWICPNLRARISTTVVWVGYFISHHLHFDHVGVSPTLLWHLILDYVCDYVAPCRRRRIWEIFDDELWVHSCYLAIPLTYWFTIRIVSSTTLLPAGGASRIEEALKSSTLDDLRHHRRLKNCQCCVCAGDNGKWLENDVADSCVVLSREEYRQWRNWRSKIGDA